MIIDPDSPSRLLVLEVPDDDLPAERVHFDVRPRQRSRDAEADHLLGHPEGNQLCVLRSQDELDAGR